MSTLKDKLDQGYDALCLKKGGMLLVGELGLKVLESRTEADLPFETGSAPDPAVRRKMQVMYDGIDVLVDTTDKNLISLISGLTPTTGSLNEFFNTTTNKLNVYNDNASVLIKINVTGSWNATSSNPNTMQIAFDNSTGNVLSSLKTSGMDADVMQFVSYLSIDKNGPIATSGSSPVIRVLESDFTVTGIFITVEQVTTETSITPV